MVALNQVNGQPDLQKLKVILDQRLDLYQTIRDRFDDYYFNNLPITVSNTALARNYTTTTSISANWLTTAANVANAYINIIAFPPGDMTASIGATVSDANNVVLWDTLSAGSGTRFLSSNVTTQVPMDPLGNGGTYYTNVTQLNLAPGASTANQYYRGATINLQSTYVYKYNYAAQWFDPLPTITAFLGWTGADHDTAIYGKVPDTATIARDKAIQEAQKASVEYVSYVSKFTANVTDYYAPTRTVTLDKPVQLSLGNNSFAGPISTQYTINGNALSVGGAVLGGNTCPALGTDEFGNFAAIFNIPGSQFFQGQRVFRIDNRVPNDTSGVSSTTFVFAAFLRWVAPNFCAIFSADSDVSIAIIGFAPATRAP
jgi:hypothetical protein